ncbi:MAG: nuclear transport factor 2 family protein [Mucilaginibacter sp.]|jgi:hypothetical protein|nr:nuclear transport factor 2 family protein [Mucilaginibacter sp.]
MKTLKSIVLSLVLLVVFIGTKAAASTPSLALNKDAVINIYLNAIVHGKLNGIDDAIDDDAHFNMIRGQVVNTLNKNQILNYLKAIGNTEQNCTFTTDVIKERDNVIIIKVEMKYNELTRTDIVTEVGSGNEWKITKVDTSFK